MDYVFKFFSDFKIHFLPNFDLYERVSQLISHFVSMQRTSIELIDIWKFSESVCPLQITHADRHVVKEIFKARACIAKPDSY